MSNFKEIMRMHNQIEREEWEDLPDEDAPESGDSDGDFVPPVSDEDADDEEDD